MGFKELKEWQKVAIAFAGSYILLFALQALLSGAGLLGSWENIPTFYLLPIPGFFFAYLAVEHAAGFFETDFIKKPWFVIIFLIMALLAWHVALVFYTQNNISLSLQQNQQYLDGEELQFSTNCKLSKLSEGAERNLTWDSFRVSHCLIAEQYWQQLKTSAYLVFILSAILGWASSILIKKK
ncbi:MAG: hypothetical protein J4478_04145 [Candidatus Diapherotrites archaeon]|uniref:Uncharacterized protein n=1 Tax=Candidatus Iainarchaeum sp. TaxID=3101447 RepID=A0A7J4JYX4_9ARCH|nr:hypothetical protein [Candidatus Diapherotrites archaeon]HIH21057.1 hypothetical protein [Candidatus Diapherotrites archaeon]HIH32634.1 hypothetical protein [Candidatus Diapherotrites archaeon]